MSGPGDEGPWPGETYGEAPPKRVRTDVLDDLRDIARHSQHGSGTSDGDVNVFAILVAVQYGIIVKAIQEIERLRAKWPDHTLGGPSGPDMPSFREIKQEIAR